MIEANLWSSVTGFVPISLREAMLVVVTFHCSRSQKELVVNGVTTRALLQRESSCGWNNLSILQYVKLNGSNCS